MPTSVPSAKGVQPGGVYRAAVPAIERLRLDHAASVLVFERENRSYFAASVSDRGDAYFTEFQQRLRGLVAEQEAGVCHFHVVVGDNGEVLGRVNLVEVADGSAELGFVPPQER
jgi:ribosomal-protein-alanine N-acetyltransferase